MLLMAICVHRHRQLYARGCTPPLSSTDTPSITARPRDVGGVAVQSAYAFVASTCGDAAMLHADRNANGIIINMLQVKCRQVFGHKSIAS